jgi:alkanesulfonate monooxygenase SsuD/methylene tetrahydromethanopterin reductase-like flavin-dependent oxidoreductase (luciferase family)
MRHPLHIGLKQSSDAIAMADMKGLWRLADESDFDHYWVPDHYASTSLERTGGISATSARLGDPVFECWTLLAAIAEATHRIRLGSMVTGNLTRPPWLLAKMAVTVDHLSSGRVNVGLGAGWSMIETRMYDIVGLRNRVGRLDESLTIIRSLWTQERTTFDGRYYTLREAVAGPKPLQRPQIPIWIGAGGPQMMRVVARHADVWHADGEGRRDILTVRALLEAECERIGRDPAEIATSSYVDFVGRSTAELIDLCAAMYQQGVTEQIFNLTRLPAAAVSTAASLAEVVPRIRAAVAEA